MTTYDFKQVIAHMRATFERVDARFRQLDKEPSAIESLTGVWFNLLRDCSHDDCLRAIQQLAVEENQPRQVEGYPRRIRAYAQEIEKARHPGGRSSIPEDRYLRDCAQRANAIREAHALPPLAEPYRRCTPERARELMQEGRAAGMKVMASAGHGPLPTPEAVTTDPPEWPHKDAAGEPIPKAVAEGMPDDGSDIPFVWILTLASTVLSAGGLA